MLFALFLLLPLLALVVLVFWRLSPRRPNQDPVTWFNVSSIVLGLVLAGVIAHYVRQSMEVAADRNWWPVVAGFYGLAVFPFWLAIAGLVRRLIFGTREVDKPLELTRDLTNTRF